MKEKTVILNLHIVFSVAACPVAKKRKLEENISEPSAPKISKIETQPSGRNKRGKNKEKTVSENGKTSKVAEESKCSKMVEIDIENIVREEESKGLQNDKSVSAVSKSGEKAEQVTVDIKTEKNDEEPQIEIKTEPQELDCFKEAEQAIRRLSSAGNEKNVTYSVEMVNAGSETVYVKHEVDDVEMTSNVETEVKKDEPLTEKPSEEMRVAEDTGDIFSRIEAQCAQIQRNETHRNESNLEQEQKTTSVSQKLDRVSQQIVENVAQILTGNSDGTNSSEIRSESPGLANVKSVIHNSKAKEAVVRLSSREETSEQIVKAAVSRVVADLEKPDDIDDEEEEDGEESDYMVLAEWTDGKEEETLPPGEKENMKLDKGKRPPSLEF